MIVLPTHAAQRISASYEIVAETADGGGGSATSLGYSNDGSVGCVAGIGNVVTPVEIAKHGYIGQLYHVSGLVLTASPTTINEDATRQLNSTALLDDSTLLILAGGRVAWSVVSGPIASVDPSGLATAGIVYQDSPAIVRADFQQKFGTLGLTVLDVNPDNYGSYAGDGLPDWWQVQYFGLNNPNAAPGADPDGDGQNNAYEYVVGTVPTNAASHFSLSISGFPGLASQKALTFSPRLADRTYLVEFSTNLHSAGFSPLTTATQNDAGSVRTVTDTNATATSKFYRVNISLP